MRISELIWNDENVGHIARHGVNPLEVEDVCFGAHLSQKERNDRYILGGQTEAGRYLNVVVEKIGKEIYRPVTAFEMSETYKGRYRKRMRSGKA
ncbi:MAG: hypothetical protein Q7T57_00160 [Dehalococcoidales bacterium]|nr:hypothetical protein [Dehalococcoidales bacterium]